MKNLSINIPLLFCLLLLIGSSCGKEDSPAEEKEEEEVIVTEEWLPFNAATFEVVEESEDAFHLNLTQNAIWYHGEQGGLIYRTVSGDFNITATVRARKRTNYDEAVDCNVCLGGLMARSPENTNGENYVHIVTGMNPAGRGVETKITQNGVSEYTPANDGTSDVHLRIQRQGTSFTMYKRALNENEWTVAATYQHPGLPNTLQVGINIYTSMTGSEIADLSMIYEDIVFE